MGRGHEQTFLQRRHPDGQQTHENKCSLSLGIREIQIKTTMRFHFTPVRMAKINNSGKYVGRMWRKGNSLTLLVGMQAVATTLENSMEIPQLLKIELPHHPAIAVLGIYPKNTNVVI